MDSVKYNLFSCVFCGGESSDSVLYACKDTYLKTPYMTDFRRCLSCALVQQHPMPADVTEFYKEYPIHKVRHKAYSFLRRIILSGSYKPPKELSSGIHLLDFGCGDGWYLEWCREAGLNVVGYEPSEMHAIDLSSRIGIDVFFDLDLLVSKYEGAFDIITLNFVVEHMNDFMGILTCLARLLRPGGVMRFVVPSIESWEFRLFGRSWHSLDAPRHVVFPGLAQAPHMASKLGLVLSSAQKVAFPNGLAGSIATLPTGYYSKLLFAIVYPIAFLIVKLAPGGNIAVILKSTK